MSEYWVSKKKYLCKYCDIYIADDAPSKQHHENGLRHKGNVERFIRGIYKAGEKHKKDLEEEKREMKRVEQAAAAAFAADVGAGLAKVQAPVASTSAPKKPVPKPSNPFANYSTAQSLGYTDPDIERLEAEAELRRSQGIAGEWQVVTPQAPVNAAVLEVHALEEANASAETGAKREAETPLDEEDTRTFKLRKKTFATGLGEVYDPGLIPIKVKKKEPKVEPIPDSISGASSASIIKTETPTASEPLKWKTTQWKRAGESSQNQLENTGDLGGNERSRTMDKTSENSSQTIPSKWAKPQWTEPLPDLRPEEKEKIFKAEDSSEIIKDLKQEQLNAEKEEKKPDIKAEEPDSSSVPLPATGILFKKRKAPANAGRGRREM